MPQKKARVRTDAWARANLAGFQVTGDLFGADHNFIHADRAVRLSVPNVTLGPELEPIAADREIASFRSSWVGDRRLENTSYQVNWIEIVVKVKEQISLPPQLLPMSPKRPEIAGPHLTKRLDALIIDYEGRIAGALEHWEQVVRWIAGSSALGSPSIVPSRPSASRLSFTSFVRASDKHRYWLPTHAMSVLGGHTIDALTWQAIGSALASGHQSPIWFRYVDEAHHRYMSQDLTGAILSCAIACETLAREAMWIASGATKLDAARDLIDRAPIRAIISRWPALTGITKAGGRVKEISRVFDLRNRLMHAGGKDISLDRSEVRSLIAGTREFVRTGDEWHYEIRCLPNPRLFAGNASSEVDSGNRNS